MLQYDAQGRKVKDGDLTAADSRTEWIDEETEPHTVRETAYHALHVPPQRPVTRWLVEEVTVNLNEVHPDIHSLYFVIAARRGLASPTCRSAGLSPSSPHARGVSRLGNVGELPRVRMAAYGASQQLQHYMYDGAVSAAAAENTEGVIVARLVRVTSSPGGQVHV